MSTYRLIRNEPAEGAWNMAVDEALMESVGEGRSPATLRLYRWEPACLSLGYGQKVADVDQAKLEERGWGLVRRLTGGKAILHTDELTYAIVAKPEDALVAGTLLESYQRIAKGLLKTLEKLGAAGEVQENSRLIGQSGQGAVCFEVPSAYEITAGGRKLIGSAQARRGKCILQHGSLPLEGELGRIIDVLRFESEDVRRDALSRLREHATTLEEVLGRRIAWEEATGEMEEAFGEVFPLSFERQDMTTEEAARARELMREKYSAREWTMRV